MISSHIDIAARFVDKLTNPQSLIVRGFAVSSQERDEIPLIDLGSLVQ
jgi:hypothetical protein